MVRVTSLFYCVLHTLSYKWTLKVCPLENCFVLDQHIYKGQNGQIAFNVTTKLDKNIVDNVRLVPDTVAVCPGLPRAPHFGNH